MPPKTLTWIAIACFVFGLGLTGLFVNRIVRTAPSSPQPVEQGTIHLTKVGLTVYASVPVLRPPCEVRDPNGAVLTLQEPSASETITINSETWYVVARTVDHVPPGDYTVSCTDDVTSAVYAAGPRSTLVDFAVSILAAIGSVLFFSVLGASLLTVNIVRRRRANRPPTNTFPVNPGGPGAPGNYPQQGNTFPGYPPPSTYNPGPNPDRPQGRPQDQ